MLHFILATVRSVTFYPLVISPCRRIVYTLADNINRYNPPTTSIFLTKSTFDRNRFFSFSDASRRFMMRTCNGFEARDQIPPLPPEVAFASSFDSNLLLDHHIMNVCERYVLERLSSFAKCYRCPGACGRCVRWPDALRTYNRQHTIPQKRQIEWMCAVASGREVASRRADKNGIADWAK